MAEQKKWSMARNALSIAGINISAGAGNGGFLKVTPRADWRTVTKGLHGDTVVNEMADHSADFELVMLQTSTANKALMALANRTQQKDGDIGLGPFHYEEIDTLTEVSGDCVLTGPPEYSAAGEAQDITWKGVITHCDFQLGGRSASGSASGGITFSFSL